MTLQRQVVLKAVRARGRFMQEAVPAGEGAMAAILGLEPHLVKECCEEARRRIRQGRAAGQLQLARADGDRGARFRRRPRDGHLQGQGREAGAARSRSAHLSTAR